MAHAVFKLFVIALFFYKTNASNDSVCLEYYPLYHFAPPLHTWMNDPNGFSKFNNEYHLFYQHNPYSSDDAGTAHWGHAKSPDLVNWVHLDIALYPDETYDADGVFSGSAIVDNGTMYIIYTGNVDEPAGQYQALAVSHDGKNFTKYSGNPIIYAEEHQPNIRDPKVWKHNNTYYMVLGNSYQNDTLGRILLYKSDDKINWTEVSVLATSNGELGYMWECPDFFELDGYYVLLFSPQGIPSQGDNYRNLYSVAYFIGTFDYETYAYTILTDLILLDSGHDFYATQTILDDDLRRIMLAWFDMWESDYAENICFTGCSILPRELSLGFNNSRLLQKPVKEISAAIGDNLYSGKAVGGTTVKLQNKAAEIIVKAPKNSSVELFIESKNQTVILRYNYTIGRITLDRGGDDGVRTTKWKPSGQLVWRIFVDASSVELFCGNGEVTFSSRFFPSSPLSVRLGNGTRVDKFVVNSMKRTIFV